jgi:predicted transcriptional regulator
MSNISTASILRHDLFPEVQKIIEEEFGSNYEVTKSGEVYVLDGKQPFKRYAGTWHLTGTMLRVEVDT